LVLGVTGAFTVAFTGRAAQAARERRAEARRSRFRVGRTVSISDGVFLPEAGEVRLIWDV